MTNPKTTMDPPPVLGLPAEQPVPPTDCERCARLVEERARARAAGDWSQVSDCNVAIRAHHRPRRKRRKA
jgi:hypothetical protein